MSERKLPEELLHRILAMHFARLPETFCGDPEEGSKYSHWPGRSSRKVPVYPTSNALLVSKCWLRIGTPLLYEFLSLTTSAHVHAVAAVFRAHPGLGKTVRHVRLREVYGKELKLVLGATPNVESLAVRSMDVKAKDSVVGLVRPIPLLDPSALYIKVPWGRGFELNQKHLKILRTIESAAVNTWSSLKLVHFLRRSRIPSTLSEAISQSPCIEEISIYGDDVSGWLWNGGLKTVAENKNIGRILYRGGLPDDSDLEDDSNTDAVKLLTRAEDVPLDDWFNQEMRIPHHLRILELDESDSNSLPSLLENQ